MRVTTIMQHLLWLLVVISLCRTAVVSAQESSPRIAFLHLKLESNQVSMAGASIVPGTLKRMSAARPALELEVATSAGQVLWTNTVADPSLHHLEYEDPDHPGAILNKQVQLTNVEFTARVPLLPNAHHVSIYRPLPSNGTNASAAKSSTSVQPSNQRTLLGVVMLPLDNKTHP